MAIMASGIARGRVRTTTTESRNMAAMIYQYSNMAPRLSGQNSIFGVVFFVSKSLLGIERQKKFEKFAILTRKPRSHARILIYRTWPQRHVSSDSSGRMPSFLGGIFKEKKNQFNK